MPYIYSNQRTKVQPWQVLKDKVEDNQSPESIKGEGRGERAVGQWSYTL